MASILTVKLLISLLLVCVSKGEFDFEMPDDWIDPSDMINFNYETKTDKKADVDNQQPFSTETETKQEEITPSDNHDEENPKKQNPEPKSSSSKEEMKKKSEPDISDGSPTCKNPFLQRFVSVLQKKLVSVGYPPHISDYELDLHVEIENWLKLQGFAQHCSPNVADVTDILEKMFTGIRVSSRARENQWKVKFEDFVQIPFQDVMKFVVIVVAIVAILTLEAVTRISWTSQMKRLIIVAFLVTIPLTYIHELKLAEAEYKAKAVNVPKECQAGDKEETWLTHLMFIYRDWFSVNKDPCAEYHANFLISPHIKVTPTKVLAVTLTRFAVEPLEHVGTAFSKAFKNIFAGLPVTLWIPAFLFVVLVILGFLLIIAVCFGYNFSFNLPFWAGLQMGPQQASAPNPHMDQILADNRQHIEYLHETIRDLRSRTQQALPAPPPHDEASPGRVRSILGYFGIGGSSPPPSTVPPPPRYPDEPQPARGECPYPEFETRPQTQTFPYPLDHRWGDGVRRRHTHPAGRPHSVSQDGDGSHPAPYCGDPATPTRGPNNEDTSGMSPIGFEHLLVENVEDEERECESDIKMTSKQRKEILRKNQEKASVDNGNIMPMAVVDVAVPLPSGTKPASEIEPSKMENGDHKILKDEASVTNMNGERKVSSGTPVGAESCLSREVSTLPVQDIDINDNDSELNDGWEEVSIPRSHDHEKCEGQCEELDPELLRRIFEQEAEKGISLPPSQDE